MKPVHRNRRLGAAAIIAVLLAGAAGLALFALRDSVSYFKTPSDYVAETGLQGQRLRLGGLVALGSVRRGAGVETFFRVTDGEADVEVVYSGVLPDLFREGQGVIAEGVKRPDGVFEARSVLAKHDENYAPRELKNALPADEAAS